MPTLENDGARLYYEVTGNGDPMVLVHGSWDDHEVWGQVVPSLAGSFRVLTYDRRSQSTMPEGQGSVNDDISDLAAMIETVGAPAHVVANSFGAAISIALAARQPDLLLSLAGHEPPLLGLLAGDPETTPVLDQVTSGLQPVLGLIESGRNDDAARIFVDEVAVGPGTWQTMAEADQRRTVANAPTFLDELRDPDAFSLDLSGLERLTAAALLTGGDQSPPFFAMILSKLRKKLPAADYRTITGWGHVPHETHPDEYAEIVTNFVRS
jgi:pimeloyl-ACP methyl ester carboxylesterase